MRKTFWSSLSILALCLLLTCWWPFGGGKKDDDEDNEADEIIEMSLDDPEGEQWNDHLPNSNPGEEDEDEDEDDSGPDTGPQKTSWWPW